MLEKIPQMLRPSQVLMLDVSELVHQNYVGGGFIGGYAEGINQWHAKYYAMLEAHKNAFIGKDQPWMWKTCDANKGLCKLVVPDEEHGDPWFYMAPYMVGLARPTNLDQNGHFDLITGRPDGRGSVHDDRLKKRMLNSIEQCLTSLTSNMPINKDGQMKAHHWDARTPKWNEHDRWKPMELTAPCTIWYVGANTHGRDGVRLQNDYSCDIHVFEPVPSFASALQRHWERVPRSTVHAYGLGLSTRTVVGVETAGESTFAMEGSRAEKGETLHIRSVEEVWRELGSPTIALLHVNCEGCEWEMWEALLDSNLARHIRIIQVGTHWFPQIKDIERRYCDIETKMKATHKMVFKQAFGWERWEMQGISHTNHT
jgi:FkbM family methyltransferase